MTLMEPRVAERRKTVAEDRARKRLKWILVVIAIVAAVVGTAWLIRSPVLSIRDIEVTGAEQSNPGNVVRALGMGIGTPTIDVDDDAIEAGVLADPWVSSVLVDVTWPGSVAIRVTERQPIAPVLAGDEWVLVASDGGVIHPIGEPLESDPLVAIDVGSVSPGDVVTDADAIGALEFITHLSIERRVGVRIRMGQSGLIAEVNGHTVRLGRSDDMREKATVLDALLDDGIDEGASIDLIAPLRPAVTNPQPQVETEE